MLLLTPLNLLFCKELLNGLRYPLVGGTRQRRFAGTNLEIRKLLEMAKTHKPIDARHASLPLALSILYKFYIIWIKTIHY